MKVTLIAEGSTKEQRMARRWGISFLIGEDVLFDTFGDGDVFMHNVRKFRIDLSRVRHVVISHDDWDHIAGLWPVIETYKNLAVYVGPHFNQDLKDRIRSYGVKLVETPEPVLIREGVYTTGELTGHSPRGVLYEQSLVIRDNLSLGVVTGCAHPCLADILRAVRSNFGDDIGVIVGGFHLKDMDQHEIRAIIECLAGFGVLSVAPLHCTGGFAVEEFGRVYGDNYICLREGDVMDVGERV
jgi:7,8-dihydropterin-6-yl-methyl-4-(beta-D-ribofuranosyl)aminobenzene 5'-phosphate synthase